MIVHKLFIMHDFSKKILIICHHNSILLHLSSYILLNDFKVSREACQCSRMASRRCSLFHLLLWSTRKGSGRWSGCVTYCGRTGPK